MLADEVFLWLTAGRCFHTDHRPVTTVCESHECVLLLGDLWSYSNPLPIHLFTHQKSSYQLVQEVMSPSYVNVCDPAHAGMCMVVLFHNAAEPPAGLCSWLVTYKQLVSSDGVVSILFSCQCGDTIHLSPKETSWKLFWSKIIYKCTLTMTKNVMAQWKCVSNSSSPLLDRGGGDIYCMLRSTPPAVHYFLSSAAVTSVNTFNTNGVLQNTEM